MFWSQVDDNSITDLLIKQDVTLEDILDHESILQECKIQNENLIKFFCTNINFSKLLDYVLITPSEDIEEKVRFKYPSLVCEVLTSDVREINEILINGISSKDGSDVTLFTDRIFDSFNINISMNPLTISYITKILLNILKHDNNKVMNLILKREDSLDLLLKHVANNAISVFFTEFIACDEECSSTRIEWLKKGAFVNKCARMFAVTKSPNGAVQDLLCEVISASWKFCANKDIRFELRRQFNDQEFLDMLFAHLANPNADCDLIMGCLKVIRAIVDFEIECEDKKMSESIKKMIIINFHSINTLLSSPPKQLYDPMPSTLGLIAPFGPIRLEIVYLLQSLLKLNDVDINSDIGQTNILNVLLNFVSQYKWNTMFQLGLLKIFDILFSDLSTNSQYKCLLAALVTGNDIYNWFITTITEATEFQKPRPGTIGMLWKIGNHLDCLRKSSITDELTINKTAEDCDNWSKIVVEHLQPRNDRNTIVTPKIDSYFKDVAVNIVDIDEDSFAACTDVDKISELCRGRSSNLNDIFDVSNDDDDWIENQLNMPTVPFDEPSNILGLFKPSNYSLDDDGDDSSSDDEVSPAVIKQKSSNTECKYIMSDLSTANGDLTTLYDVPDFSDDAIASFGFDNPWNTKLSTESVGQENWANFSS